MDSHSVLVKKLARLSAAAPVPLDTSDGKDYTPTLPENVVFIDLSKTVHHRIF